MENHNPIPGMESVVATVSGYHGSDRFNLIKLIAQTGASYVGTLSRSTTHLVCWKFEGEKYNLAKKFEATIMVNHGWIQECVKQRKRVPEYPYMLRCGQELGPLVLEFPIVDKSRFLNKNSNALRKRLKICDDLGLAGLTHSIHLGNCGDLREGKRKCSRHGKRKKIVDDVGSSLAESSCAGQRISRKSVNLETVLLDSDEDGERDVTVFETGGTSDAVLINDRGFMNEAFDDIEEIGERNQVSASMDLNLGHEDGPTALGMVDRGSPVAGLNGKVKEADQSESVTRLDDSMELSCVICMEEFSSTRGVLSCGHRFCYSCIQDWADIMASKRKIATCPLCKASFVSIIKVDDAATSDQKIYSQTIPCGLSTTNIPFLTDQEQHRFGTEPSLVPVCSECRCREPEDLLISCHLCQIRCIHSYCLDPPLSPWTCIHCKDLQMLYNHSR